MYNCKENAEGENLSNMETDPFVNQWTVRKTDQEAWFGIFWSTDEIDSMKEIPNSRTGARLARRTTI